MRYLFLLLPLMLTSCNMYKHSITHVVHKMVHIDDSVYEKLEKSEVTYRFIKSKLNPYQETHRDVLDILKKRHNDLVESISSNIKKGDDVRYKQFDIGFTQLNSNYTLVLDKIKSGLSEYESINPVILDLVGIFLRETANSFLLTEYSKVFLETFSIK